MQTFKYFKMFLTYVVASLPVSFSLIPFYILYQKFSLYFSISWIVKHRI